MQVDKMFPQRPDPGRGADISVREIVERLTGTAVALCQYLRV